MKKIVIMLASVFILSFTSLCMAADGGALDKAQGSADKFIGAFNSKGASYSEVASGFDSSLKEKINDKTYAELQKQVKEKFGVVKGSKFYSFQRFDDMDKLTYIVNCSKEKLVAFVFVCDKRGKVVDFMMTPVKAENSAK